VAAAALVLLAAGGSWRSPAAAEEPQLAERVNAAIDRGVAWLRARQRADGTWGDMRTPGSVAYDGSSSTYDFPAGPTAFAMYTLLKCGVAGDDPGIQKGFDALRKISLADLSTYEIAAMALALEASHDQVKREAKRDAAAGLESEPGARQSVEVKLPKADAAWMAKLVEAINDRWSDGGWRYFRPMGAKAFGAKQDMSSTAVSMLAVLAAHRCGVEVPRKTLVSTLQFVIAQQEANGPDAKPSTKPAWTPAPGTRARGWAYVKKSPLRDEPTTVTGNMTTAGLICLLAAELVLADTAPETLKSQQTAIDKAVADGVAWLGANWTVRDNPPRQQFYSYMFLYGLERVGDLRRVALIAGHDWYAEGAQVFLTEQKKDGQWLKNDTHAPADVLNTCFALLFLDRASLAVTTPK
jgi:hypothetical protein